VSQKISKNEKGIIYQQVKVPIVMRYRLKLEIQVFCVLMNTIEISNNSTLIAES